MCSFNSSVLLLLLSLYGNGAWEIESRRATPFDKAVATREENLGVCSSPSMIMRDSVIGRRTNPSLRKRVSADCTKLIYLSIVQLAYLS